MGLTGRTFPGRTEISENNTRREISLNTGNTSQWTERDMDECGIREVSYCVKTSFFLNECALAYDSSISVLSLSNKTCARNSPRTSWNFAPDLAHVI